MFVTGTTIEPIPDTAQHFRDLFQTDASNLKRMTLVLIDHGDESAPDRLEFLEMPFAWSVADSLDHLLLAFTVPRMPKGMIARCLTDLQMELDILPTQLIARMLNESPSLQRFTVNTTGIRADRPSEALTHATLGFFHISVQKMDTEDSLQAFHFPALKRAEILFDDGPDGVNLSPTNAEVSADHKRALIQSVCSGVDGLEQILIQRIEADESLADTLIALGLRHLKSLELANSILYASFWDKLAAHVEDFPCLTNLRCFNAVPTSEGHDYEVRFLYKSMCELAGTDDHSRDPRRCRSSSELERPSQHSRVATTRLSVRSILLIRILIATLDYLRRTSRRILMLNIDVINDGIYPHTISPAAHRSAVHQILPKHENSYSPLRRLRIHRHCE